MSTALPGAGRRRDPGPLYWAAAAGIAACLAAPLPFFWAPPIWIGLLMAPPP